MVGVVIPNQRSARVLSDVMCRGSFWSPRWLWKWLVPVFVLFYGIMFLVLLVAYMPVFIRLITNPASMTSGQRQDIWKYAMALLVIAVTLPLAIVCASIGHYQHERWQQQRRLGRR